MATEPDTEALRRAQAKREADEREGALRADDDTEEQAHERRADKAAYLSEKLAQRATSEQRDE